MEFPELTQLVDSMIKTSTNRPATAIIHWDPKRQQLKLKGPDSTKKFFDGQYVRNMLSRSANEVGTLVYDGALKVRSSAVEKPQKEDITSLGSQALRTHVADFTKKFMRLKHDGIKQGYWEREYFRPPFWPGDIPFISPNDRTKGRHLSVEDLKLIVKDFYEWLDGGNWEKLSQQSVKRTAPQGDSATSSAENGDAMDGHTSSGVKRVKTTSPQAMDEEAQSIADINAVTTAAVEQTSHTDATDQWRPINNSTGQLVPPINQQQYSALNNDQAPGVFYQDATLRCRITDGTMAQYACSITGISPLVIQDSFADSSVNSRDVKVNNFGSSSNDNSIYIDVVGMDTDVDKEIPGGTRVTTGGIPMTASAMTQRDDPPPHIAQVDQRPSGDDRVMHTLRPPDPQLFTKSTQNYLGDEPNIVSKRTNVKRRRPVTTGITYEESQTTRLDLVATPCDGMDGISSSTGVCVLGEHVVVGDYWINRVHLYKRTGPGSHSEVSSLGGRGSALDCFNVPRGMCTGYRGLAYVADCMNHSVKEIDIAEDGQLRVLRALTAGGRLKDPMDVCTAYNSGQLLVACVGGVHVIDVTTGDIISTLPTPTGWTGCPVGVACRDGLIVVAQHYYPRLLVYTAPYTHGVEHTIQGLKGPVGVFIDNQQNILVTVGSALIQTRDP